ncbi:hypothetical protein OQA88_5978 [Cercophora sp. LCS_1]
MKPFALTLLLLSPLCQALGLGANLAAAAPLLAERQTPQARFTSIFASGTGCPSGSLGVSTITNNGQDAALGYNKFNVSLGGTSPQPRLVCSVRLDITIPAGCSRIDISGRYGGFGRFGRTMGALQTNAYSATTGTVTPGNDRFEFRGTEFADGEATDETVAIVINTGSVPREQNTRFTIDIEAEMRQSGTQAAGFFQVQVSSYAIRRVTRC